MAVYRDSLEEHLLLTCLRKLRADTVGGRLTPAMSTMNRNDILFHAKDLLAADAYQTFVLYELSQHLAGTVDVLFPPQLSLPEGVEEMSLLPAEAAAYAFLNEGRGSIWVAMREVVALMPFERKMPRAAESQPSLTFAAGAYGDHSFSGVYRHTFALQRACRLINAFLVCVCPTHRWTTFQISCDNTMGLHKDKQHAPRDNLVYGISHFCDGHLWWQDEGGTCYGDVDGQVVPGCLLDLSCRGYLVVKAAVLSL
eukprot:s1758_g5.t1